MTVYRESCKMYGAKNCCVAPIWASVNIEHFVPKPSHLKESKDKDEETFSLPFFALSMPRYHCSLTDFCEKYRPLKNHEIFSLLKCGIQLLSLCKKENIIHNDIKPDNIFVNIQRTQRRERNHSTLAPSLFLSLFRVAQRAETPICAPLFFCLFFEYMKEMGGYK